MKKGIVLSIDAAFSLALLLFILAGYQAIHMQRLIDSGGLEREKIHIVTQDSLEILNKQGILDDAADAWARGDNETLNETLREELDDLIPYNWGYVVFFNGTEVANRSVGSIENATLISSAERIITGYQLGGGAQGWTARAWVVENKTGNIGDVYLCDDTSGLGCVNVPAGTKELFFADRIGIQNSTYLRIPKKAVVTFTNFSFTSMSP